MPTTRRQAAAADNGAKYKNGTNGHKNGTNGHQNGTKGHTNGVNGYQNGDAHFQSDYTVKVTTFDNIVNRTLVPLFLMVFTPNLSLLMWYTSTKFDGSYLKLIQFLAEKGVVAGCRDVWSKVEIASPFAVYVILGYMAFAILLMVVLPGPRAEGPVTPKGNVPVYKDNGFYCFLVTIGTFAMLTYLLKLNGTTPTLVYDNFGSILATLTVFSHLLCIFLHFKGLFFPSTTDSGSTGNLVFDYYWGTELYPRVFGIDIKVFTNCRFGMTIWPLCCLIFAVKSYELYGFVDSMWVSCAIQMLYFAKFFWWESGYMRTIDIMVDRAGFYICWGCLVYITGFYTSVSLYLVTHPVKLGTFWSLAMLFIGAASVYINYAADEQKQYIRNNNGNGKIWNQTPTIIRAKYTTDSGAKHESILLASGYWGIARHFHYVPELILAFFWSLPGLFENVMVYSYFIFLFILLVHRTYRDDEKCRKKYGPYWEEYCKKVPYKMIPGIF